MDFTLNPKKSAQAAAILLQLNGGSIDKYAFIKMLYWADRVALEKWDEPITGATVASMQYGQVLSEIYDLTKGDCPWARSEWEPFISDANPDSKEVSLKSDPGTSELSRAEIKILQDSFAKFKDMGFHQLKEFFKKLPEHEEVGPTSKKLPFKTIMIQLGRSPDEVNEIERRLWDVRTTEKLLGV